MEDAILKARVDALEQSLDIAVESRSWLEAKFQQLRRSLNERDALWAGLEATIGQQARNLLDDLKKIRAQNDPQEAWRCYNEIYEKSREIFSECSDLIGGLAIRDLISGLAGHYKGLDEKMCQVADELIRSCAIESIGERWVSLSVLASQESLTKTLARIIRLRFPEWTIWSLPFTAHEYGHVVFNEVEELRNFVNKEVACQVEQDRELQRLLGDAEAQKQAKEGVSKWAKYYLQVLLADAFAIYTMGPAYAYSAILLRFNPSVAYTYYDEHPSGAKRAHIVLTMLKRMSEEAEESYKSVIEYLEQEWKNVMGRAGLSSALEDQDEKRIEYLVNALWELFRRKLFATARYPHTGTNAGWLQAKMWQGDWSSQLGRKTSLSTKVSLTSKLRDVLNAAWLCRIDKPDKVGEIADAAHQAYEAIMRERDEAERKSDKGRYSSQGGPATRTSRRGG